MTRSHLRIFFNFETLCALYFCGVVGLLVIVFNQSHASTGQEGSDWLKQCLSRTRIYEELNKNKLTWDCKRWKLPLMRSESFSNMSCILLEYEFTLPHPWQSIVLVCKCPTQTLKKRTVISKLILRLDQQNQEEQFRDVFIWKEPFLNLISISHAK